jgi:hypothetical protein
MVFSREGSKLALGFVGVVRLLRDQPGDPMEGSRSAQALGTHPNATSGAVARDLQVLQQGVRINANLFVANLVGHESNDLTVTFMTESIRRKHGRPDKHGHRKPWR